MKKALTKVLLLAVTLVIFAAIIPLSASASTSDNKDEVFKQLTTKLDFNPAAACGIMANIERESDFDPTLVITDSNGLPSGGLCQWNGGRFNNLKNYCRNYGYDYLTVEGQIAYLSWEMAQPSYSYIYNYIKNVPNNAEGAYDAAWYWCYYYEIPSNRSTKASQRGSNAKNYYWPEYGAEDFKAPELSLSNKKNPYDIDHDISFKWSNGGEDVTNYYLYVTAKNAQGKYDWSKAKIGKYSPNTTAKTVSADILKNGDYAACVRAYNAKTGKYINSNFTNFTIKCLSHQCVNTVIEPATFEKEGKTLVTCKQCGAKATKVTPKLTFETFNTAKVINFRVTGYNESKIRVNWDKFEGVDGYQVFRKIDSKWISVAAIKNPEQTSYIFTDLEPGVTYELNIRAFKFDENGKAHFSKGLKALKAATKPADPVLKSVDVKGNTAVLNWDKVEGVDGYAVYVAVGQDNTKFKLLAKLTGDDVLTYSAKPLQKGQFYYFTVKSYIQSSNGYSVSDGSDIMYVIGK